MNTHLNHTLPLAVGKCIYERAPKLALYKECLAVAAAVADPRVRDLTINEVRSKWRQGKGDGGQVLQMNIATCLDRISYGRMCITKQRLAHLPDASERYDWSVANPLENHEKIMKKRADKKAPDSMAMGSGNRDFVPMTNWGYKNMDPDMIKRHKELTDRQYFMGPHWRNKAKPLVIENYSFEEQLHIQFQPKPKIPKKIRKEY